MSKINVAVVFGGRSPEYNVSLASASSVVRHLDREKYSPILVGITQAGDWYHFCGEAAQIENDTWYSADGCAPAMLSPNSCKHRLLVMRSHGMEEISVDVAFPVLHGKNGEDGTIQGLCELAGLPLAGCGTLASALAMDKDRAHKLVQATGIAVPRSFIYDNHSVDSDVMKQADQLGFPLFVKPVKAGSSYGISKIAERGGLKKAIEVAMVYDDQVIIEEFVPGFEVGCAVMGNATLITGEVDEIELADGFFDFTEKYELITSQIHVPARISLEKANEIKHAAKTIYCALGCRGFARVDMFLKPSGEIVFNEVNTIPGFTPHSRFPSMMKAAGMSFEQVITHAIDLAVAL